MFSKRLTLRACALKPVFLFQLLDGLNQGWPWVSQPETPFCWWSKSPLDSVDTAWAKQIHPLPHGVYCQVEEVDTSQIIIYISKHKLCKCLEHNIGKSDSQLILCRGGRKTWAVNLDTIPWCLVLGANNCNKALEVYWSVFLMVVICRWGVEWWFPLLAPGEILLRSHNEISGVP